MADLAKIQEVIARARRRLRIMAALDAAVTAGILGVAAGLVVLWLWRMEVITRTAAVGAAVAIGAAIVAAALVAAARRLPGKLVATRIDRASGLADRLGSACDFSERLAAPPADLHPDTRAFMEAAIADGVAAVPRADVKAASPFHVPRDLRALVAFAAVGAMVGLLAFGPEHAATASQAVARPRSPIAPPTVETLDPDDLEYQRQFVEDMKQLAEQTRDQALTDMARELDALLDRAQKGEIGKQELIQQMEALEKKYAQGSSADIDAIQADLKEQSKELKKQPVTKKLGEALEKGDLDEAKKELEKLADKLEKNELEPEEQKQLADALEKTAEKQEERDRKAEEQRDKQAQKEIDKKVDEIRRLQKKVDQEPQNEEAKRTLQKEKRELDRLEREQQAEKDKPKRQLDRLTRDMKKAAESLRQKNQQQSSKDVREAAGETQKVQDELRRLGNQKKVQSQLNDLKEAIRRAKPKKGGGQKGQQQARMQRIQEWEKRAGGQRGNAQAWRPQDGNDEKGQGKEGELGKQSKPSQQWGEGHDPDLMDDPTARFGKTRDERLTGVQGQGPTRRETILTSAKKGFAHAAYKNVYVDYRKAAEEVMSQEKVPQGYKYYVKRYFDRIKPHSMD